MGETRSRFWRTAREYVMNWAVGGLIIMATGFAPEELVVRIANTLRIPNDTLHLWTTGIDIRTLIVFVGVAVIVGDLLMRGRSTRAARVAEDRRAATHTSALARGTAADGDEAARTKLDGLPLPIKPSIAVLPFQNISGDPDQEYFADGVVEDIITALSRVNWLFVIARNSSFIYKGRAVEIKQIALELGVRYVLEGSVRLVGGHVRITAQLIDAGTGANIWAERYDRPLNDIFALQDEITLSVVGAIEPSLRQAEIARVKRKRPENLGAYDLVLRALPNVADVSAEQATNTLPLLEQALALEPNYGLAHALTAWCHQTRFIRGDNRPEDREAAIQHAHTAIACGGDDATALAVAGFILGFMGRDSAAASDAFERALDLSPSNFFALGYGAVVHAIKGDADRAIDWGERALRLSPFDPLIYAPLNALAIAHLTRGEHEKAVDAARRSVRASPGFYMGRLYLTAALIGMGRVPEARQVAAEVLAIQPSFRISDNDLLRIGAQPNLIAKLKEAFQAAGLPE
jgi:adenylate cyclase